MEKLFKTLVSLDFTTTQQFTTGRDAPPLHPFFLSFFLEKDLLSFWGKEGGRSNRRASTRPCQSDTAHTRPCRAALGDSEYPTTPRKALWHPVAHKTLFERLTAIER